MTFISKLVILEKLWWRTSGVILTELLISLGEEHIILHDLCWEKDQNSTHIIRFIHWIKFPHDSQRQYICLHLFFFLTPPWLQIQSLVNRQVSNSKPAPWNE